MLDGIDGLGRSVIINPDSVVVVLAEEGNPGGGLVWLEITNTHKENQPVSATYYFERVNADWSIQIFYVQRG